MCITTEKVIVMYNDNTNSAITIQLSKSKTFTKNISKCKYI